MGYPCRERGLRSPGVVRRGAAARARAGNDGGETRRGGALYTPLGSVSAKFSSHWKRLREPGSEDEVKQRGRETATRDRRRTERREARNYPLGRRIATERSRPQTTLIIPHHSRWQMAMDDAARCGATRRAARCTEAGNRGYWPIIGDSLLVGSFTCSPLDSTST